MLSDALSDAPRATLPSPVNLEEFLKAAAARQAAERAQQEQRERQSVVWVPGLAGNAKRNSLGSVTTKRLPEKRSSSTAASPTAAAVSRDDDAIGSLLRHLKLQEDGGKQSPRTLGSRRGSRAQQPGSPSKRLVHHNSAPGSKRPSLLLSHSDATDHTSLVSSTPPMHPLMSPTAAVPSLMSPTGLTSPNRRRRSIPPRPPTTASASHALPSVEHLRAVPFLRPSVVPHAPQAAAFSSPLASSHQPPTAASPLLSPLPAPPSPTTRRSSMPCQSAGPLQRFWSDTRQAEFNGRRNSGSGKQMAADERKEGSGQVEEGEGIQVKVVKQVRWREEVEYEGGGGRLRAGSADAVVIKTAADPSYSWLPIGASLRVEQ